MGATSSGEPVQISKSTFLSAMRFRKGIESGEIVAAKEGKAGGDKDIQETLDLLDASSFGDDSWEDVIEPIKHILIIIDDKLKKFYNLLHNNIHNKNNQ